MDNHSSSLRGKRINCRTYYNFVNLANEGAIRTSLIIKVQKDEIVKYVQN